MSRSFRKLDWRSRGAFLYRTSLEIRASLMGPPCRHRRMLHHIKQRCACFSFFVAAWPSIVGAGIRLPPIRCQYNPFFQHACTRPLQQQCPSTTSICRTKSVSTLLAVECLACLHACTRCVFPRSCSWAADRVNGDPTGPRP